MHHVGKIAGTLLTCIAALAAAPLATAAPITDAEGDFIAEYLGPERPDLDVIAIEVMQTSLDFILTGRMAGDIDTAAGATYVWGVNRGAGIARFPGYSGILFDTVIVAQAAGTVAVNLFNGSPAQALDPAVMSIDGDTLTLRIAKSLLPSTGFVFNDYGFNLWPRASGAGGITQLSDFAPDNALVNAVPEPATLSLAGLGLACLMLMRRRVFRTAAMP